LNRWYEIVYNVTKIKHRFAGCTDNFRKVVCVNNQLAGEIFVGVVVTIIALIITPIFQGRARWPAVGIVVTITAVYVAYLVYTTQRNPLPLVPIIASLGICLLIAISLRGYVSGFGRSPFIKWRVKLTPEWWVDWKNQRPRQPLSGLISGGDRIGDSCLICCSHQKASVYGPYLEKLPQGKYRAIFRIMLGQKSKGQDDQRLLVLDITTSRDGVWGTRGLAQRELTPADFANTDHFQNFLLDFDIPSGGALDIEFRAHGAEPGPVLVLEYIQLRRRLF